MPVAEGEDAAPAVPARAFRVVCDNMLQGLARSLRCLGVDALVLGTGEDHRRAAEVSGGSCHPGSGSPCLHATCLSTGTGAASASTAPQLQGPRQGRGQGSLSCPGRSTYSCPVPWTAGWSPVSPSGVGPNSQTPWSWPLLSFGPWKRCLPVRPSLFQEATSGV